MNYLTDINKPICIQVTSMVENYHDCLFRVSGRLVPELARLVALSGLFDQKESSQILPCLNCTRRVRK